jgi:hypothetical protein
MKRPLKFPLKFEKGIRIVTRKRTATEAMPAFKKFYAWSVRQMQKAKWGAVNESLVDERVRENIEGLRKTGFDKDFLELCRHDYSTMSRRAPRKKIKRAVDANKIPKVTKTPLDRRISPLIAWEKRRRAEEKVQ